MPRVKRGTKRNDRRKKILKRASGYFLTKSKLYQAAQEAVERGLKFAYSGRKQKKRQYPLAVDRPHQRRRQDQRHQLLAVHPRPEGRRSRARPQDAGRYRRERRCGFYRAGRTGQRSSRQQHRSRISSSDKTGKGRERSRPFHFCCGCEKSGVRFGFTLSL